MDRHGGLPESGPLTSPPKRHTVLVVDDEPVNVRALAEILRETCRVVFALNGPDALRVITEERPDLILLDIMMPGMDGFAVCREIRDNPALEQIPIIFVTAAIDINSEVRALAAGAVDFISKPLSPPVAQARVKAHLALKDRTDELHRLASIDGLTDIANRRVFDNVLEMEWQRAWRARSPLAVAMIDVDHFKMYNDHYGHQAGDHCLQVVATALRSYACRTNDVAARYGGEEFALILPGCGAPIMADMAERIRSSVADLGIPHAVSPVSPTVTVSIGMACLGLSCDGPSYPQAAEASRNGGSCLVKAADQALYQAKQNGRNRAVCSVGSISDFESL